MIGTQQDRRPLLFEEYSNESRRGSDEYEYSFDKETNGTAVKLSGQRYRHQSHRRMRRMTRFVIIFIAILIVLLLIYIPLFNNVQSRLTAIPGWGYNTSRNVADYINPGTETAIIKPRSMCLSNFFLLIVVCSSVENFNTRQIIRETWGNVSEFNYPMFLKMHSLLSGQYLDVKESSLRFFSDYLNLNNKTNFKTSFHFQNLPVRLVFIIGKVDESKLNRNETIARLELESEQYDDVIQENFYDTYNNLTIKSIMMLKWVINNCQGKAKFLMKCDDDTFVNVPNLLHVLLGGTVPVYNAVVEFYDPVTVNALSPVNRMTVHQDLLTGYMFCSVQPIKYPFSKWYSPVYMFKGDIYPNYLSGSGYLMSFDVIAKLYNISLNISLLHLEDVYLTGICAEKIHLKRRHHPLFSFNYSSNKCAFKGIITQHYVKGDLMRDAYTFAVNTTTHCPQADKQNIRETWGNVSEFNYPMFLKMHSHLSGQYLDVKELSLRFYSDYLNLNNKTNFNASNHLQNLPVRLVFLIGKSDESKLNRNETVARLKLESEQYDDLIQEDFYDTYNNLTIKSIMMLKWVVNNCQNKAKFLMKCDDDTFVNVPNLLHVLLGGTIPVYNATIEFYDPVTVNALSPVNRMTVHQDLLTGYMFCMVKPIADTSSKWYSPVYMFKGDIYPNYLSGSGYLMSFDVIAKLYNISLNISLLHLEDVYLTGICAEKIHLKRRHHPLFSFNYSSNKCAFKGIITQHYVKGDLMRDAYTFAVNTSTHCPQADKYFKIKRLRKRIKYCQ